ncbi:hypothetical protein GH816_03005 [Betaproteobacteria bacterium LSUCC0115]|nr:hypothetical protein [Burkholderiales bacterium LSUCC0115]
MTNLSERILAFERKLQVHMHEVFCPTHLSIGQEHVAEEMAAEMIKEDWLFSTHRNHHHYLAKGGDEQKLWDEIMGLESGLNGGFAGSQGITDRSINFHASAIVGGLIGVAAGAAFSLRNSKSNAISISCIGDAASEQGVFWEVLNFAVLYNLPLCIIMENNGKSVDAHISERQVGEISPKVAAFGVKTFQSIGEAIRFTRDNRLPSFVEVKVKLKCAHLNMATMLDLCDQSEPTS